MKRNTNELTVKQMVDKVHQLTIGDVVEIPIDENKGIRCIATVQRIYPRIVQFEKKNGGILTLSYFDAMKVKVIQPSKIEKYNEEMAMEDMLSALERKE